MTLINKIIVLLFLFIGRSTETNISLVSYLEEIINEGILSALTYEAPTDAKEYEANQKGIKEYGSYDFVIIGGGAAGSVVGSRLSEIENFSVLVLETGDFAGNGFEQFLYYALLYDTHIEKLNWGYSSVPQKKACLGYLNESCEVPRGKGLGGSTLINEAIYSRGSTDNYNQWANITQDASWRYDNILHYFKKSERFHWTNKKAKVDLPYHGKDGLIQVQQKIPDYFLNTPFIQANKEFGIYPLDYNGPEQLGTSILQYWTKFGKREDLGSVFLKPFLKRSNLKVLTGSYVTKIEINNVTKEAESVLFTNNGSTYRVKAKKEVILSAGAVASPQILMLSGIGPKKHLESVGIDLIEDLEVGSFLQEHPSIILRFSSNITTEESLKDELKEYINGRGDLTASTKPQNIAFYRLKNTTKPTVADMELITSINEYSEDEMKLFNYKPDVYQSLWGNNQTHIAFYMINLVPKSTGTLRIKSKDPFEYPLIDLGLLTDPKDEDIDVFYQGIQFAFKLIKTRPYQKFDVKYLAGPMPPCKHLKFKSKKYWYCYIRQIIGTTYHVGSTCKMGASKPGGAVVNSNLEVFGVKKLRVVDASVFPTMVSGHNTMPTVMIAEKVSDVIKLKYTENRN